MHLNPDEDGPAARAAVGFPGGDAAARGVGQTLPRGVLQDDVGRPRPAAEYFRRVVVLAEKTGLEIEVEGQQQMERIVWGAGEDGAEINGQVDVDFPPLVEENVKSRIDAIVAAATLGSQGMPAGTIETKDLARMLLNALGEDDVDEMVNRMFPEDGEGNPQANALGAAMELRRVFESFFQRWSGDALRENKRPTLDSGKEKAPKKGGVTKHA